jgi:hypothetical protein
LVLYDRMQSMERFAPRPLMPGGGTETPEIPAFGDPLWVRKHKRNK